MIAGAPRAPCMCSTLSIHDAILRVGIHLQPCGRQADKDVVIAHVDCTNANELCSKLEVPSLPSLHCAWPCRDVYHALVYRWLTSMHLQVRGYPTLQLHHNGAMVEAYRGARALAGLAAYAP